MPIRTGNEPAAPRFCLKCSPLFDVDEAFRLFGACEVEVVSLNDECKEVVVRTGSDVPRIAAAAVGRGGFSLPRADVDNAPCRKEFDPARYGWLVVPDVALRKARLTCACLGGRVDLWSNDGYGFAAEHPGELLGSVFAVERIEPYDPSRLRRETHSAISPGRPPRSPAASGCARAADCDWPSRASPAVFGRFG